MTEKIKKLFEDFGREMAEGLKQSSIRALRKGGRKNPNDTKLDFDQILTLTPEGNVILDIRAVNGKQGVSYWRNIEEGRKPGARNIPAGAVGKKWQNQNNIDPRKVLLEMKAKKGIKVRNKQINYDKAAKSLSFIIQRSIRKKGIPAKPYIDSVITTERITKLRNDLVPLLGENFILAIKGLE